MLGHKFKFNKTRCTPVLPCIIHSPPGSSGAARPSLDTTHPRRAQEEQEPPLSKATLPIWFPAREAKSSSDLPNSPSIHPKAEPGSPEQPDPTPAITEQGDKGKTQTWATHHQGSPSCWGGVTAGPLIGDRMAEK
jgi:hypothetical protein